MVESSKTKASEWVYEYDNGDNDPKGPFPITKLEIKAKSFSGEGKEDGKYKYDFQGTIDSKACKFEIIQVFIETSLIGQNKVIQGDIKPDGTLVGRWSY